MFTSKIRIHVGVASEGCLVNLTLRKPPLSLLPRVAARFTGHPARRSWRMQADLSLTSLGAAAWARGGRLWRKGLAWKGRRSSGPRSPPSCAVVPFPSPPESRSLWGRTLPGHGGIVRTLRAPSRLGVRCPLPPGGRGWERWTAGSETSSWQRPRLEVSAAHSSSLSGRHTTLNPVGECFFAPLVSERGGV